MRSQQTSNDHNRLYFSPSYYSPSSTPLIPCLSTSYRNPSPFTHDEIVKRLASNLSLPLSLVLSHILLCPFFLSRTNEDFCSSASYISKPLWFEPGRRTSHISLADRCVCLFISEPLEFTRSLGRWVTSSGKKRGGKGRTVHRRDEGWKRCLTGWWETLGEWPPLPFLSSVLNNSNTSFANLQGFFTLINYSVNFSHYQITYISEMAFRFTDRFRVFRMFLAQVLNDDLQGKLYAFQQVINFIMIRSYFRIL